MAIIIRFIFDWIVNLTNVQPNSYCAFLAIRKLSKQYRGSSSYALKDVSLDVNLGELTALTGPNGAGKTTLLGIISSAVKASSGEIYYKGSSLLKSPKVARRISASMPQWYAPIRGVNVLESLSAAAMIRGVPKAESKRKATAYLEQLGIGDYAKTCSEKLSGGLQRLVSFGMTALQPAELYLFDEPTNDIDASRRLQLWQHMRQLADNGHAVMIVTHDMQHTTQYVDRFMVVESGKLVLDATPDTLTSLASQLVIRFNNSNLPIIIEEGMQRWKRVDEDKNDYYLVPKTQFSLISNLYRNALQTLPDLDLVVSPVTFNLIYHDLLQQSEGGVR